MRRSVVVVVVVGAVVLGVWLLNSSGFECGPREKVLLGGLSPTEILDSLPAWKQAFEEYQPDSTAVAVLRQSTEPLEILVFLGTWCEDSEREVPRFMKAMAEADNDRIRVKYYGVPRGFKEKDETAIQYQITAVPTFIVRRGVHELGRIVETAELSVEEDLAMILLQSAGQESGS